MAGARIGVGSNMAFEDDLRARRHLQVAAEAFHRFGPIAPEQPGELVLGQRVGHWRDGAQDRRWIGAKRDGDRKRRSRLGERVVAEVERASAVGQPPHDHLVSCEDLLPVDAEVLPPLVRTPRHDEPPCDQRTCVTGPTGLDRKLREVDLSTLQHDLLARGRAHLPRRHVPQRCLEQRDLAERIPKPAWRLRFFQTGQQLPDLPEFPDVDGAHGLCDPTRRPEKICQDRHVKSGGALEQERWSPGTQRAVGNLRHFKLRRDRHADSAQFAGLVEAGQEVAQITVFHRFFAALQK